MFDQPRLVEWSPARVDGRPGFRLMIVFAAALLMAVFAVMYRTGTTDLNKLGGLVTRMPLSFLVLLFGIISLAGIPPMAGFVSKWMVYRSLLTEGMPLLFVASVIGTLGTILSVYKLIHNMFLGQLRVEHEDVREAPLSMLVPMLVLEVPFGKWSHLAYRPLAIYFQAVKEKALARQAAGAELAPA